MTNFAQRSFASGELTPSLHARVDLAKYATGLRTCRNFTIARHGGAVSRPGTTFVGEIKDSTKTVRLIPFVFNNNQSYVIEAGNLYFRFYKNGSLVRVTGVSAWDSGTAYDVGDLASRSGVNYYCILAHTNHQPPNATYWYPLTSDIYEIPTPYYHGMIGGLTRSLWDLQFAQSADVMTIVHPNFAPKDLQRFGDTAWVLETIVFGPGISNPTNLTNDGGVPGSIATSWAVTAVSASGEESTGAITSTTDTPAGGGSEINLTWDAVSEAVEYRIYREFDSSGTNGTGLIGTVSGTNFTDAGDVPESGSPPEDPGLFNATGEYPSTVVYSQQRRFFANSDLLPETIWGSRIGSYSNFHTVFPQTDDGPVTFSLVGRYVNEVMALLELRELLALTSGSEWVIQGNADGLITPTQVNAKQQSYNGSKNDRPLTPLNVNDDVLYIQAKGSIIRNLGFDIESDGYRGNDMTIFASHLFRGYDIEDWAYQQTPDSIVWVLRDDGTLAALTYIKEHQLIAWHHHDFSGQVESITVVPEVNEDYLYMSVIRVINGSTKRYIERLSSRLYENVEDAIFMDSALSYDGRHTGTTTMTLSGGTDWTHFELLTLTASASYFSAGDVGNQIFLTGTDGTLIRFTIEGYTSGTVVTGRAHKTVPVGMRSVAIATWGEAVDQVAGLSHLEGETVAIFADGFVVGSPNNSSYQEFTVTSGTVTLDKPYLRIHVGLPITADLETLDIDVAVGESVADKKKLITKVTAHLEESRGLWAGPKPPSDDDTDPLENLTELKIRNEEGYDDPVDLHTGPVEIPIRSEWNSNGRVFIRQIDPVPLAILALIPGGLVPIRGG